ncbi:MAG: hypothetical protein JKX85_08295 [Phycisphaeraceae bacterium]|nr:hypothetical protein [Phycisphaeraceae bacterium]
MVLPARSMAGACELQTLSSHQPTAQTPNCQSCVVSLSKNLDSIPTPDPAAPFGDSESPILDCEGCCVIDFQYTKYNLLLLLTRFEITSVTQLQISTLPLRIITPPPRLLTT